MGRLTGKSELSAHLDEEELINFLWNPVVLLQASPVEIYYAWNGTSATDKGEEMGVLVWRLSPPEHLPSPECHFTSESFPCQHVPKAVATSASKEQTTTVILIKRESFLCKFLLNICLLTLYFCHSCVSSQRWTPDRNIFQVGAST